MKVQVTDRSGDVRWYEVESVAELYSRLVDEMKIDGLCGGCCSCATCHVYVSETAPATAVAPVTEEEEVLAGLLYAKPESRLLCQLELSAAVETLALSLAPEE